MCQSTTWVLCIVVARHTDNKQVGTTIAPSYCKGKHEIGCSLENMTVTVYTLQIMRVQLSRARLRVKDKSYDAAMPLIQLLPVVTGIAHQSTCCVSFDTHVQVSTACMTHKSKTMNVWSSTSLHCLRVS